VPFVNRPRLSRPFGESELADVIPLADAVNKLATDMMVTSEFHASKRRWATGIEIPRGPESRSGSRRGPQGVLGRGDEGQDVARRPGCAFGQFTEASLTNFVSAIELLTSHIAALSGLPPHYLGLSSDGNPASADAIRSSEAALVKRAQRKQRVFGGSWERVMRLALRVRTRTLPEGAQAMETIWGEPGDADGRAEGRRGGEARRRWGCRSGRTSRISATPRRRSSGSGDAGPRTRWWMSRRQLAAADEIVNRSTE
jgi:hypothetical protein